MYFIYHSSLQPVCPTHALSSEAFCLELVTLLNMLQAREAATSRVWLFHAALCIVLSNWKFTSLWKINAYVRASSQCLGLEALDNSDIMT